MAYVNTLFNTNFLEYASYVIKDRAIPHLDDGLKPVQRRILHSLFEMDDGKFHKVANVVGHCMKYHPHGDQSIYSALVVLANKDLFIDKQGNFGNQHTGDEPSAARYIECRVTPFAKQVLHDPELTEYEDSYDSRNREPVTFPAKIPVVLVQGTEGIAVGMSTKILPHNLIETLEAVRAALRGEPFALYPDFPTGGIVDVSEYEDGLGKVLVRAKLDTKDPKKIVIRELPFGSTTAGLIASVEAAARKSKLKIAEINDYTTETVEIEIKLARGVYAKEVLDALYAFTECEQSITVNLLVIRDGRPATMTVTEVVQHHAKQLVAILKRELENEQRHLRDRLHARTLERIFIEERIYKDIEEKETQEAVVRAVIDGFVPFAAQIKREVTEEDVDRLLKIPIRRISRYDINKARQEIEEIKKRLREVAGHLQNLIAYAVGFLDGVIKERKAEHKRRTEIVSFERTDVREAAQRNLELRYDEEGGYLGYEVKKGKLLFEVSQYDRILVIRKNGTYSVIDVPDKLFVDKGMLACGIADKERLAQTVLSILYKENDTGFIYLKRCRIEQYILQKTYELVPEGCAVLRLTTRDDQSAVVVYKPRPRVKILEEAFPVADYLVKSVKAAGVRLTTKDVRSVKFERTAAKPAAAGGAKTSVRKSAAARSGKGEGGGSSRRAAKPGGKGPRTGGGSNGAGGAKRRGESGKKK